MSAIRSASRPRPASLAVAASLLALCGCGDSVSRTIGLTRDAPDEFQVTTRAPLSMPPDYSLRPPRPGASRPQEQTQTQQAEATLVPEQALAGPGSADITPGQQALIASAGPPAPANIRQEVNSEAALETTDRSFSDRLMFWKPTPLPGVVVDPTKEAQRLRTDAALGASPETGDTPIIQRKTNKSLFDSIF